MLLVQVLPALALVNAGLLANAAPIVSEKHVAVVDKREPLHPALWVGLTVGSVIKGLARSKEAEDEFLAELSSIETRDFEAGEGMEKRLIAAIGSRLAHGIMNSGSIGSAVTKVANVFNKFRSRSLSDSEEALEIERRLASALDEAFESKEAVDELLAELSSIDAGDFEDDEGMAKRLTYSQDRKNRLVNFILKRPSIRKPLAKIIDTFKSRSLNDPEEGFEKRIASALADPFESREAEDEFSAELSSLETRDVQDEDLERRLTQSVWNNIFGEAAVTGNKRDVELKKRLGGFAGAFSLALPLFASFITKNKKEALNEDDLNAFISKMAEEEALLKRESFSPGSFNQGEKPSVDRFGSSQESKDFANRMYRLAAGLPEFAPESRSLNHPDFDILGLDL